MKKIILKISQKHFNSNPQSFEQILDKGKVNQVYKVQINNRQYIFRLNKKDYLNTYQKEWFCITKAGEKNIPISSVYFMGTEDKYSYMILDYIKGVNGLDTPEEEKGGVYKTLGKYAKKFNSIEVSGFGGDVRDEKEGFYKDWNSFYKENIESIFEDGVLIKKEIMTTKQVEKIRSRLSEMKDWNFSPKLCHGNLHISNTIISPDKTVYLIDWGNGVGHKAPHVDLADLIAWKDRKYLNNFLEGYSMSEKEFNKIKHDVNNLLIVQLLSVIKRAIDIGKKFNDEEFISNSVKRIERIMSLD